MTRLQTASPPRDRRIAFAEKFNTIALKAFAIGIPSEPSEEFVSPITHYLKKHFSDGCLYFSDTLRSGRRSKVNNKPPHYEKIFEHLIPPQRFPFQSYAQKHILQKQP